MAGDSAVVGGDSAAVAGDSKERLVIPAGIESGKVHFTQPHSDQSTDRQDTVYHDTMSHATPILTDIPNH